MDPQAVQQLVNAMGVVEKAVIVFEGSLDTTEIKREKPAARGNRAVGSFGAISAASGFKDTAAAVMKTAGKGLVNMVSGTLGLNGYLPDNTDGFEVQFNPATIVLNARGGALRAKINRGESTTSESLKKSGRTRKDETTPATIEFSVDLIFDDVNNDDAFMEERLNPLSGGEIGKTVAKTVSKAATAANLLPEGLQQKQFFSVRETVEAFTCAARVSHISRATFNWGKISYTGVVNSVTADYTMFNPKGEPIRAVVHFGMLMMDSESTGSVESYWESIYEEAFGQGSAPKVSALNKYSGALNGSILNI